MHKYIKNIVDDYITPDRKHSALLVIDVQHDFTLIGAPAETPGTLQAVQYIQRLIRKYREQGAPIIHVIRLYSADGSNVDFCRRKAIESGKQLVIPGSDGAELIDELKPTSTTRLNSSLLLSGNFQQIGSMEWIMYKPRWGAFYKTSLEKHLHNLGVNTVVVCGCNFPNCPRTTIYEASERDFRIVLAKDATSLVYDIALQELQNIGVSLMDTDECIAWLGDSYSKIQEDKQLQHKFKSQLQMKS
jgi:nicotinamidase-related amidase